LPAFRGAGKPERRSDRRRVPGRQGRRRAPVGSPPCPIATRAKGSEIQSGVDFGARKRKEMQGNKRNFPFISFQQFFGIRTFQRVTADSNEKNHLPPQLAFGVVQNAALSSTTPTVRIRPPADNNFLQQNKLFDNSVFVKIKDWLEIV
jgi:hypothetical protein